MALDKAYFDSINIDVAKKKYYNVNKVEAVLQDIRREAEALNEENASLRREVERMNGEKRSVGDALISARELAQQIISEANAKADEIVRAAQEKAEAESREAGKIIDEAKAQAEEILRDAQEQRDRSMAESQEQENYAAQYVLNTFEHLKERQLEAVRQLNEDYQKFLCGLFPEDEAEATAQEAPAPKEVEPEAEEPEENDEALLENMETVPEDLREKVSAIARVLRAIDGD